MHCIYFKVFLTILEDTHTGQKKFRYILSFIVWDELLAYSKIFYNLKHDIRNAPNIYLFFFF